MHPPQQASRPGLDGYVRSESVEAELNQLAASVFRGENGRAFLNYLRSITVNAVCGPDVTSTALHHREGMRFLMGIIDRRIAAGQSAHVELADPPRKPTRKSTSRTARVGRQA